LVDRFVPVNSGQTPIFPFRFWFSTHNGPNSHARRLIHDSTLALKAKLSPSLAIVIGFRSIDKQTASEFIGILSLAILKNPGDRKNPQAGPLLNKH
jgi:hypothetical protein